MKGPYSITATLGGTSGTHVEQVKREAIRWMRRTVKLLGVMDQAGAQGEVRDGDGQLVKQVEAYRTPGGAVKLRDLEL